MTGGRRMSGAYQQALHTCQRPLWRERRPPLPHALARRVHRAGLLSMCGAGRGNSCFQGLVRVFDSGQGSFWCDFSKLSQGRAPACWDGFNDSTLSN